MSVDLYIEGDDVDPDLDGVNVTYNLAGMWRESIGIMGLEPEQFPERIRELEMWRTFGIDGMTGREATPLLTSCIAAVDAAPEVYRDLEPSNGWGTVEWFKDALERCLEMSIANPDATWRASR